MRWIIVGSLCSAAALAQSFEVASVKVAAPVQTANAGGMSGRGSQDPGRIALTNYPMSSIVTRAYGLPRYQIVAPEWFETERFDLVARVPDGATKEQIQIMFQNLLAERFHMAVHHETKEVATYELVVGKRGSKLKETDYKDDPSKPVPAPGPPKRDANGAFILESPNMIIGMQTGTRGPMQNLTAKAQPVSALLGILSTLLRAPVIDKTGFTGKYDFNLEFAPDGPVPLQDDSAPNLQVAIQEQLGLRLDSKKAPVDMLVIDRADKIPTEN